MDYITVALVVNIAMPVERHWVGLGMEPVKSAVERTKKEAEVLVDEALRNGGLDVIKVEKR